MENISNQLSYLKGLIDGLKIDPESDQGRIFESILNVFDEINDSVDNLTSYQDELAEEIEQIDDDLAAVEEEFASEDDDEDYDDMDYYEIECPHCGATVCLDEDFFDGDEPIVCPECKKEIEIDFDCDGQCDQCSDPCEE